MKKLLCLTALLLFVNTYAQELAERIPKSATMVIVINPGQHITNGDIANISKMDMFTGRSSYVYGDTTTSAKTKVVRDIFSKPAETGVDQTKKIFMFQDVTDSLSHWTYLIPLTDANKFKEYLSTKVFTKAPTLESGFGFSYLHQEKLDIAWTSGFAMIMLADYNNWYNNYGYNYAETATAVAIEDMPDTTAVAPAIPDDTTQLALIRKMQEELAKMEKLEGDSLRNYLEKTDADKRSPYEIEEEARELEREAKTARHAKDRLRYYMSMLPADAVTINRNFRTIQLQTFDAAFWYNYGEQINSQKRRMYGMYDNLFMTDTAKQERRLWDDSYFVALASFKANEMVVTQQLYLSPQTTLETKGMYHGKVKKKMFRYVKSPNLMGYAALSMNPEKIMKFSGSAYRDAMSYYNSMSQGLLFTSWDIARVFIDDDVLYNLFSGDLLFAVTDLRPFTASYVTYDYDENFNRTEVRQERTEVMPEFVAIGSIGKVKEAKELLAIIEKAGGIRKQGTAYYVINLPGSYDFKIFMALKKDLLIITNNEELIKDKLDKGYSGSQGMSRKEIKEARRSPLSAKWNGDKSFELAEKQYGEKMSKREKAAMADMKTNVRNVTLTGTRPQNGIQTAVLHVTLNEGTDNGLVRFFRLMNTMYRL